MSGGECDDDAPGGGGGMTVIEVPVSNWRFLNSAPGTCPECAVAHDPAQPHDRDSLTYQMKFVSAHAGKSPTWADAMAHCTGEVKSLWTGALGGRGIAVGEVTL
jgi:hypothetical protein